MRVALHAFGQGYKGAASEHKDERRMSVSTAKRKEGGIAETMRVIFHALIIALVIRTFLFQPFNIPSGSMKADAADRRLSVRLEIQLRLQPLFAAVLAAAVLRPHLSAPSQSAATSWCSGCRRTTSTDYIKRVIGLPGDRIQMIDGVLNINGAAGASASGSRTSSRRGRRPPRA